MSDCETPLSSALSRLDDAIWRSIAYAGVFQYPLRLAELQRRLLDVRATEAEIAARLAVAPLRARVTLCDGFVTPVGREDWVRLRRERTAHTDRLLARHRRALRVLAGFPFVRMAALSGGCAHGNASDDDVDVFLVTKPSRAWTVTVLVMMASKAAGLRRSLCINYVLAADALAVPEQDTFTAAELVGLRPFAGRDTYLSFVRANAWAAARHPNFFAALDDQAPSVPARAGARALEGWLEAAGAGLFERLTRRVLGAYLRRRVRGTGVDLSPRRLKLHGNDHLPHVSRAFEAEAGGLVRADTERLPELTGVHTA
jgi:hypothetical protein